MEGGPSADPARALGPVNFCAMSDATLLHWRPNAQNRRAIAGSRTDVPCRPGHVGVRGSGIRFGPVSGFMQTVALPATPVMQAPAANGLRYQQQHYADGIIRVGRCRIRDC